MNLRFGREEEMLEAREFREMISDIFSRNFSKHCSILLISYRNMNYKLVKEKVVYFPTPAN